MLRHRDFTSNSQWAPAFRTHPIEVVIGVSKDSRTDQQHADLRARHQYEVAFASTGDDLPSGLQFQRPSVTLETTACARRGRNDDHSAPIGPHECSVFCVQDAPIVSDAQIRVDRPGISQRLQVSRVELYVHMPKLKREHRAVNEPHTVAGNNLLPSGLPFRFRSAKRRAVVLRCSPFRSQLRICGKSYVKSVPQQNIETLSRPQLLMPSRQITVE